MDATRRILAIDDNATNLDVIREALHEDYTLELASDGMQGLTIAKSFLPEVILLDVMMPGLDGYEVCRRVKSTTSLRQTRIIMVSARSGLEDRLLGYEAGADDYVTKPFAEIELRTKIDFAIRTSRLEKMCGAAGEVISLISWLRDSGTVGSLDRTRECARLIAEELREGNHAGHIDDRFVDDLHHASVLRDVGELAIPESVREQAEAWTAEALERMKEHTLVGSKMLGRLASEHPTVSLFAMASEVARSHHEHFDGTGYPDRLAGEAIPLAARILTAIDAFEVALERDHLPDSRSVFESIARGRGTKFDPEVADAFVRILQRMDDFHAASSLADVR